MTNAEKTRMYLGEAGADNVSAKDFARVFANRILGLGLAEPEKLEAFGDSLLAGKAADIGWEAAQASATPFTTWSAAHATFVQEFDVPQAAEKTSQEWEKELAVMRIGLDELGTKIALGGVNTHAHIAFARKLMRAAKKAGVDKSSSNIWAVRDHFPDSLKDKTPPAPKDWTAFTEAIEKVDVTQLIEAAEKERRMVKAEARTQKVEAELAVLRARGLGVPLPAIPASPTAHIRTQLGRTNISSTHIPAPAFISSPKILGPEAMANLIHVVERMRSAAPLLSTSATDVARYNTLFQHWKEMSSARPVEEVGVPLSPGTVWPGSGECWNCSKVTAPRHNAADCDGAKIPLPERRFRRICSKNLPRTVPVAVNAVLGSWMDDNDEQGFPGESL
ncbi:unnamed protein product [Mycena citricolor]|uniref:Uncharacterized protein n=1 Tax=Mycena citricolor TaxID=2018698 RepID=A0AAD2K2Y3_9AGAR|nr:unnamed protein product [Mycena citricolor]